MQRRWFLLLFAASVVALFGCSRDAKLKELSVDEVSARIAANDGKTFLYDNNEKERWQRSHLPGAKWLDYEKVTAADFPADKTATLVFYCASEL